MKDVEAKLVIIGEGSLRERLENKVRELAIKNKVFLLPALTGEKLINFYKACTVFVLPSIFRSEAFGIVLIEAMAAGKPVISTEVGTGTSFVNQNRVTGFVVSPKDSRALAQAIKKILGNKKLAQEFGQNALKRAREKFSLEKMLEEISRVYRDI
jgi:glycosyltransferase involved in cell wall biosynthesis